MATSINFAGEPIQRSPQISSQSLNRYTPVYPLQQQTLNNQNRVDAKFMDNVHTGSNGNSLRNIHTPDPFKYTKSNKRKNFKKWLQIFRLNVFDISRISYQYIFTIASDPKTRKVFFFLLLNLSFTFVEGLYGYWTNSLGLSSDAVHMAFDCSAIILSLIASVIAKWEATSLFSFGFSRVETLAGFLNAVTLVLASFGIIFEAIERMFVTPELNTDKLFLVSFLGLLVNIVGIFAFDHALMHGGTHGTHSGCSHHHHKSDGDGHDHHHDHTHYCDTSGQNHLMEGMFLHVVADALGSVGVLVSSFFVNYFGWLWADTAVSLFIAVMIFVSTFPLLKDSCFVLLQGVPSALESKLQAAYRQVGMISGVESFTDAHIWELSVSRYVGTIKVRVSSIEKYQAILSEVHHIFSSIGIADMTVELKS